MRWNDIASTLLVLLICLGMFGSSGCRRLNPNFLDGLHQDAELGSTGTQSSLGAGGSASLSTEQDGSSSDGGATDSSVGATSATSEPSAFTPASDPSTSEPGPQNDFCGQGVELCYPVHESKGSAQETADYGPSNNPLYLTKPTGITGGASIKVEPLVRSVWCKNKGYAMSAQEHAFSGGPWGVDLWISAEGFTKTPWTIVELDNVFALRGHPDGKLECLVNLDVGKKSVHIDTSSLSNGLQHVQCSFRNNTLELRVSSLNPSVQKLEGPAKMPAAKASLSLCRGQTLTQDSIFQGRVALLRLWSDLDRMNEVTKLERDRVCASLDIC